MLKTLRRKREKGKLVGLTAANCYKRTTNKRVLYLESLLLLLLATNVRIYIVPTTCVCFVLAFFFWEQSELVDCTVAALISNKEEVYLGLWFIIFVFV